MIATINNHHNKTVARKQTGASRQFSTEWWGLHLILWEFREREVINNVHVEVLHA